MHPTVDEQLDVIAAMIERDPHAAARLVRRLRRSWGQRQAFLVQDNRLAAALLLELAPELDSLAGEIAAATGTLRIDSESAAHEQNKAFQGLLATAVNVLADNAAGDSGRAAIREYLAARVAALPK